MATDLKEAITLRDEEQELVTAELAAILPALHGERLARYERLREAVDAGNVPDDLAPVLEALLELSLQTARTRQLYKAEGERILTGLYRRTPGGRELSAHLRAVNTALEALADSTLDAVSVRMRTLGHFSITITTDAATLTLGVRPESVNIESVAVGEKRGT
jgi:hypothetical protein